MLLLGTGFGLLGLAQAVTAPVARRSSAASTANVEVVRAFYDAANEVLATGDTAPLDELVAPDFVEHPARLGESGREGLAEALVWRHAVFPGLRLEVDDVRAAGDDAVAVRVHAAGAETGAFIGRQVSATLAAWGPIELLRIVGGRVAERWGDPGDVTLLPPLWQTTLHASSVDAPWVVALRRLTWEPGAELTVAENPATWFLLIEAGELTVFAEADSAVATVESGGAHMTDAAVWRTIPPDRSATLVPGAIFSITPDIHFVARNSGTGAAIALLVALWTPARAAALYLPTVGAIQAGDPRLAALGLDPQAARDAALAPGVAMQVLTTATGVLTSLGSSVAMGVVTLAPGAALPFGDGGPLVLAVEAGAVEVDASDVTRWAIGVDGWTHELPAAWVIAEDGTQEALSGHAPLTPGTEAMLTAGTAHVWNAYGNAPATFVVVAVNPVPADSHASALSVEW
jgi:hypothetical protein